MELIISLNGGNNWWDPWVDWAQIIGAGALFVALMTFLYQKKRDKALAAVDQIAFFRTNIIDKHTKIYEGLTDPKDRDDYAKNRIQLIQGTLAEIKDKNKDQCAKQVHLIQKYELYIPGIDVLNMLEEFSLRVLYLGSEKHEALNSLKHAFVLLVEIHAVLLLMQREIMTKNNLYTATLSLYKLWNVGIDRDSPDDRMKAFLQSVK